MGRLYDLAKIIRSKNSGPFELTLDVLFESDDVYRRVKNSGVITRELISGLYHVEPDKISTLAFFDQARGFKATLSRSISSGTCLDRDVYGAQQHMPLGEIIIPESAVSAVL